MNFLLEMCPLNTPQDCVQSSMSKKIQNIDVWGRGGGVKTRSTTV